MNGRNLDNNWGFIKPRTGDSLSSNISELMKNIFVQYVQFNTEFSDELFKFSKNRDFPMGWGELQNQSIVFHSIHQALTTNNANKGIILPEHPFGLKKYRYKEEPENHRIDYWISLRNDSKQETVLLIEYKHKAGIVSKNYINCDWTDKTDKKRLLNLGTLATDWNSDYNKLNTALTYKKVRESFSSYDHGNCDFITITLAIVPVYQDSVSNDDNKELEPIKRDDFDSYMGNISQRLDPIPNWKTYWWLPPDRQKELCTWDEENGTKHYVYYKGAYFFAKCEKRGYDV